nr:RNA-directed DNA polymerase, eukaryota, nucleotide-binding alpha-beta plait domain protein [Tanacetum cinerariifolium]
MDKFKNFVFKQRKEINDRMTEMFGLLKELTTSRTPEKVLIRKEAKFSVTKNVNSISLARGEEERSDKPEKTLGNTIKSTVTATEIPVKEAERNNETKNKPIEKVKNKEVEEDLWKLCQSYGTVVDVYIPNRRSKAGKRFAFVWFIKFDNVDRLVGNLYTLWIGRMHLHANVVRFERTPSQVPRPSQSHRINEKLIEGLVDNNRFNDSLFRARVRKVNGETYNVLPRGLVYEAVLKKKITKKEDVRGNFEIPYSIVGLKHVKALIDQGSDMNVMPYSTYMKLTDKIPIEHVTTEILA